MYSSAFVNCTNAMMKAMRITADEPDTVRERFKVFSIWLVEA